MTKALSSGQIARYAARLQGLRLLPILREWQIGRSIRRLVRDASPAALAALKESADRGLLRQGRYRKQLDLALLLDGDQRQADRIRAFLRDEPPKDTPPEPQPVDRVVGPKTIASLPQVSSEEEPAEQDGGEEPPVSEDQIAQVPEWPLGGGLAETRADDTDAYERSPADSSWEEAVAVAETALETTHQPSEQSLEFINQDAEKQEAPEAQRIDVQESGGEQYVEDQESESLTAHEQEAEVQAAGVQESAKQEATQQEVETIAEALARDESEPAEGEPDQSHGAEQVDAPDDEPEPATEESAPEEVSEALIEEPAQEVSEQEGLPHQPSDDSTTEPAEDSVTDSDPDPTPERPAATQPVSVPRKKIEDKESDLFESWSGSDSRDTLWDPQEDPNYPWISTLDRYVRLDPDDRRRIIAMIARSDLTIEDWIERLLHQQDETLQSSEHLVGEQSLEAMLEELMLSGGTNSHGAYTPLRQVDAAEKTAAPAVANERMENTLQEESSDASSKLTGENREDQEVDQSINQVIAGAPTEADREPAAAEAEPAPAPDLEPQPRPEPPDAETLSAPSSDGVPEASGSIDLPGELLLEEWDATSADDVSALLVDCASQLLREGSDAPAARHATLLAGLLTFHLREKEAQENDYIAHLAMNDDALEQDSACLAAATLVSCEPFRRNKHQATYRYETRQPFRLSVRENKSEQLVCQQSRVKLEITEVLETEGLIRLSVDSEEADALLPQTNLIHRPKDIAKALRIYLAEQAPAWIEDAATLPLAVSHLLSRQGEERFRLLAQQVRSDPQQSAQLISDALFEADGISLILQGPPGTGKTTCAAEVITRLVDAGWNVGICANSHLAIDNLLIRTAEQARTKKQRISLAKFQSRTSKDEREVFRKAGINVIDNKSFTRKHDVYGATVYGFSHPRFEGLLDLLVIDEASQVALANLLPMGRCARNLLLVGDQQQLAQPTLAEHPGESGLSCLSYATEGEPVIADHKGVFLSRSWRLPPTLCGFVSEEFYECRLEAEAQNSANRVSWSGEGSGLQFVAVDHSDNHVYSLEEAEAIQRLVSELLGCAYTRHTAAGPISGSLGWDDIAIVAPFNAQVNLLQRSLGRTAQVGTVDRFQGREAPVSIYSVTSSRALSTRGLEFVLEANRVNVAISRAQCLAIVVASPVVADLLQSTDALRREAHLFQRLSSQQHATPSRP